MDSPSAPPVPSFPPPSMNRRGSKKEGSSSSSQGNSQQEDEDEYVEMRPAGEEHDTAMLSAMLITFGGEVLKIDRESDFVLIRFPNKKCASSFTLTGHTFTSVPNPNATPHALASSTEAAEAASASIQTSVDGENVSSSANVGVVVEKIGARGKDDAVGAKTGRVGSETTTGQIILPEMSVTDLYKSRECRHRSSADNTRGRQTASVASTREALPDSDLFYLFGNLDLMAPLLCSVLMIYSCMCTIGIC